MHNPYVILVFLLFAGLNWVVKQSSSAGTRAKRQAAAQAPPRKRNTEAESLKQFMDALGLPSTTTPTAPISPYAMPPLVPQPALSRRPPVGRSAAPAPRAPVVQFFPPPAPATAPLATRAYVPTAPVAATVLADSYEQKLAVEAAPDPAANIRALLKDRDSIRSAILLREILGLPLSMKV